MALIAFLVLPTSAATIVLAPEIVRVLLGSELARGRRSAAGPRARHVLPHGVHAGSFGGARRRRGGESAWRSALHAALVVVAALVGLAYGVTGVAVGVVAAIAVNFVLLLHLGVRSTGVGWHEIGMLHARSGGFAVVVGLESWLVASLLRGWEAPAMAVLAAAGAVTAATALALIRFAPRSFGKDGHWLVSVVLDHLPATMQPLLRRQPAP
jgi:O-antigen/teichoic acid export membrane protein